MDLTHSVTGCIGYWFSVPSVIHKPNNHFQSISSFSLLPVSSHGLQIKALFCLGKKSNNMASLAACCRERQYLHLDNSGLLAKQVFLHTVLSHPPSMFSRIMRQACTHLLKSEWDPTDYGHCMELTWPYCQGGSAASGPWASFCADG